MFNECSLCCKGTSQVVPYQIILSTIQGFTTTSSNHLKATTTLYKVSIVFIQPYLQNIRYTKTLLIHVILQSTTKKPIHTGTFQYKYCDQHLCTFQSFFIECFVLDIYRFIGVCVPHLTIVSILFYSPLLKDISSTLMILFIKRNLALKYSIHT